MLQQRDKTTVLTIGLIVILVVGLAIALAVGLGTGTFSKHIADSANTYHHPSTSTPSPKNSGYDSAYRKYRFAAVTTDTNICSQIGVLDLFIFLN